MSVQLSYAGKRQTQGGKEAAVGWAPPPLNKLRIALSLGPASEGPRRAPDGTSRTLWAEERSFFQAGAAWALCERALEALRGLVLGDKGSEPRQDCAPWIFRSKTENNRLRLHSSDILIFTMQVSSRFPTGSVCGVPRNGQRVSASA